jgi:hypothetical protein
MKVKDLLLEAPPYLMDPESTLPSDKSDNSSLSDSTLERSYKKIGEISARSVKIQLFELKSKPSIVGVVPGKDDRNEVIFSLMFKKAHTLVKKPAEISGEILQVNRAWTDEDYRGFGIASFVYSTLVKNGAVILSDTAQFTDGKMLWKRMSAKAGVDYEVYVIDDEYGFKTDKAGSPIRYDSANIGDAEIWSSDQDLSKEHVLFLMTSK